MSVSHISKYLSLSTCCFNPLSLISGKGYPQKFMIKNKRTGLVLDGSQQHIGLTPWANKNTQLWSLESSPTHGHYIVRNIGNRLVDNFFFFHLHYCFGINFLRKTGRAFTSSTRSIGPVALLQSIDILFLLLQSRSTHFLGIIRNV